MLENPGLGLHHPHLARHHNSSQEGPEVISVAQKCEGLRRCVGEPIERDAAARKVAQQRDRFREGCERVLRVLHEGHDLLGRPAHALGEALYGGGLCERPAIELDPVRMLEDCPSGEGAQRLVRVEALDDLLRLPPDEDAAEIEDHVADTSLEHGSALSAAGRRRPQPRVPLPIKRATPRGTRRYARWPRPRPAAETD